MNTERHLAAVAFLKEAQHAGEKRGVAGLLLGRTERAARAAELQLCKEIEENNRMGKSRDLFKKIRETKGTFHAKMGSINDRNGMDLTEAILPVAQEDSFN